MESGVLSEVQIEVASGLPSTSCWTSTCIWKNASSSQATAGKIYKQGISTIFLQPRLAWRTPTNNSVAFVKFNVGKCLELSRLAEQ